MAFTLDPLQVGHEYSRDYLARLWGHGGRQGISRGVYTPRDQRTLVLFVTEEKRAGDRQYQDILSDGYIVTQGDAVPANESRLSAISTSGESCVLFYRRRHQCDFTYMGPLDLVSCEAASGAAPGTYQWSIKEWHSLSPGPSIPSKSPSDERSVSRREARTMTQGTAPDIFDDVCDPRVVRKRFHRQDVVMWEGIVLAGRIKGWVNNPRLELELKRYRDSHAGANPTDDEILEIMVSVPEFALKELAADIRVNGVRQHIIVSRAGDLLDGNRRYFAVRYLLETLPDGPEKDEIRRLPVWIPDERRDDLEEMILVQENFYKALKVEWPDYVKAMHIYKEHQCGVAAKDIGKRYSWTTSRVNNAIWIMDIIQDFIGFATDAVDPESGDGGLGLTEIEAERIAADSYQYFNEAYKFRTQLANNLDFQLQFFRWIAEGKFASFQEVRVAWDAWNHPRAKKLLMSDDPQAGKKARAVIDYHKNFEEQRREAVDTIADFVKFLSGMSTAEKASLDGETLASLQNALQTVISMSNSVHPHQTAQ